MTEVELKEVIVDMDADDLSSFLFLMRKETQAICQADWPTFAAVLATMLQVHCDKTGTDIKVAALKFIEGLKHIAEL